MRRVLQSLMVLFLIVSIGGPWVVLQSVAWVSMAVSFSKQDTLGVTLLKTFDGAHPCQLCRYVAQGRKADSVRDQHVVSVKLDLCLPVSQAVFTGVPLPLPRTEPPSRVVSRAEPPPTPPPLALA